MIGTETTAHVITEAELARIDAANDAARDVFNSLVAGGFDPASIRHVMNADAGAACPGYCVVCVHARVHAGCYGCPDC
ncbi:hypothetical protein AB0F93_29685 [Micromonospora tulbaghiae]|uniref:hypothetical protein n=1 Tax=Actinomycetes TaxID=1760 RepID=UPI001B394ED8|nr:hypothetical protein [Streptomyces sp. RM72]MBQ0890814.1 hypothetical protein [Streptomyces sp. RM72]